MKRILCVALCVMMVMSLFAGCGKEEAPTEPKKCEHTFTWSSNEASHWKTCSKCAMQAMNGQHIDDDRDGVCNDCGYEEACEHTFDGEKWMSDGESHWHPATCKHEGVKDAKAAHVDAENDGVCDVCQHVDTEHAHSYESGWSSDENQHWHAANCGHSLVSNQAAHEDAEDDGVCDVCGWYDASHSHSFEDTWSVDAGHHWYGATCQHTGATKDEARHADADGDDLCDTCQYQMCHHEDNDVDGICDICGYEDPDHTHTYVQGWGSDHSGHWAKAECHPGATVKVIEHDDRNKDGTCDVCGFVICSHVYKASWSSNDTHHWHLLECPCNVTVQKDLGEHVDNDDVPGCDICMHGYLAPTPATIIMNNETITYVPTATITWQEVKVNIPKPGRYLITSDKVDVRWYTSKDQENAPTSYASEMYFDKAGEVTLLARYFDMQWSTVGSFDIHVTMTCIEDLVLDTSRGKAELPTNMVYKVVFEAMGTGTWTLRTSINGVSMGTSLDSMALTNTVDVTVENPGDMVELYILMQDEHNNSSFVFDWELTEPFQLDAGLGQTPISVPAVGDSYKVVFTAPEDGRFLLTVTNGYLSFSEWGLGGFNRPVRTESMQQLTPELKAGETFTTWIQTVYNYPASTNVNDTLTIINVGTLLTLGENKVMETIGQGPHSYVAEKDGILSITLENAVFGFMNESGEIQWTMDQALVLEMKAGESVAYYVKKINESEQLVRTTTFMQKCNVTTNGSVFSILATEDTYYKISVTDGEIGISTNGVTLWIPAKAVNGVMKSVYEVKLEAGATYVFMIRGNNATATAEAMPVEYKINMGEMWNSNEKVDMSLMGKDHVVNMVPGKLYDLHIPDEMLKMKVKLSWNYKGVTVYVDGQVYKQGTEIFLQDVQSITAKLQNNVAMDVTFSMTVTYAPVDTDAVTDGKLILNNESNFLVVAGGQATASFTANIGGTYILNCYTNGARIYVRNALGEISELVITDNGQYVFRLEADETVEFIIMAADGKELTVQLALTTPSP